MNKDTRTTIKLNRNMQAIVDEIILLHPLRTHGSPTEAVELALDEWYGGGDRLTMEVSQSTGDKLDDLAERYGTQTTVIEIALDRMYREETRMRAIVRLEGEIVGTVMTNHAMTDEEAVRLAGVDTDAEEFAWELVEIEYLSNEEYLAQQ